MKTWKIVLVGFFVVSLLLTVTGAFADQIIPISYDMINGRTTDYPYYSVRDDTYTGGTGNPSLDYSTLSGGKGDLTDGILATGYWFQSQAAAAPYVGWKDGYYGVPNPTITFHFDTSYIFNQVSVRMVQQYRPGSVDVTVDSNPVLNFINDPLGPSGWEWVNLPIANLIGNKVVVKLNDNTYAWNTDWIMIDEVKFYGTPYSTGVPEPATMLLLSLGLMGLVGARRFRQ